MGLKLVPKTTAIELLFTLIASTTILAPSALRLFDDRFSDVNALLAEMLSKAD
jgi:hypothetical protein